MAASAGIGIFSAMFLGLLAALPLRAEPMEQQVGVFLTGVAGFNAGAGSVELEGYLWSRGTAGFNAANSLELLGRGVQLEPFTSAVLPDGTVYQAVRFSGQFPQRFDMTDYPFDRQTLRLMIESSVDAERVRLDPDRQDTRIADFVSLPGWEFGVPQLESGLIRYDTRFGYRESDPAFSRIVLSVEVSRQRSALLVERFVGFLMALMLTGLIHFLPVTELGMRIGLTSAAVFSAVGNRYGVEDMLGFDESFGLVDQITVLTFAAILVAVGSSLHLSRVAARIGPEAARVEANRWAAIVLPAVVLLWVAAFAMAML
ncbi:hypothetical protein [Rhodobacter sp. NSM]|uniref:hypothetical protein n=1 Tax=Rhodobacter sp. NSM TaxID=3457501 RepID=UPI003FD5BD36